jgi:hypothetical protein
LAGPRRLGDNAGMAGDPDKAMLRLVAMSHLDGTRPSTTLAWVNTVTPVVIQVAAGAGHWAAGRRQRALAEWTGAAGYGLVAWGLGTEAPTAAEFQQTFQQLLADMVRERGAKAPPPAQTKTPAARRIERFFHWYGFVSPGLAVVISVPWRLRHPRRLTGFAIFNEAPSVAYGVLRAGRAVQRRRPRMAAGSALIAAGSVARLRAASAEPLP